MSNRNNGEEAKWNYKSSEQQQSRIRMEWEGGRVSERSGPAQTKWCHTTRHRFHSSVVFFLFYIQETLQDEPWPRLVWWRRSEKKKSSGNRNWSILASHIHINTHLRGSTCTAATRISPWLISWFHYDEELTESMIKQEVKQKNGNGHE